LMKTLLRDLRDLALWAQIPARLLEPDLASGLPASRSQLSEDAARGCHPEDRTKPHTHVHTMFDIPARLLEPDLGKNLRSPPGHPKESSRKLAPP